MYLLYVQLAGTGVAGGQDGPAATATITTGPAAAIACDYMTGDVFLASSSPTDCKVRRVFTNTTGAFVETLAGAAGCGFATGTPIPPARVYSSSCTEQTCKAYVVSCRVGEENLMGLCLYLFELQATSQLPSSPTSLP